MSEQKIPSIDIIGAGGAGCNLVKKIIKTLGASKVKADINFKAIDTSKANFHDLGEGVEIFSVGDLGAGKDRSKCIQDIQRYLDVHPDIGRNASDITFIICSFAGGTGSVSSCLLTQRIMRHTDDKAVVIVGVVDTSSERDALNSIATLKSFNRIAKDLNINLPMLMFSNTIKYGDHPKAGRIGVDKSIVSRVTQLIGLLTSRDITELDHSDKMSFLRPQDSGADYGLSSISITASDLENTEYLAGEMDILIGDCNMAHSLLVVNEDGHTPDVLANVSYVGVSASKYVSIITDGIPPMLTQDLVDMAERYQHSAKMKTTMDADLGKFGTEDKTGLVL